MVIRPRQAEKRWPKWSPFKIDHLVNTGVNRATSLAAPSMHRAPGPGVRVLSGVFSMWQHVTPQFRGGDPYDLVNLQTLCRECVLPFPRATLSAASPSTANAPSMNRRSQANSSNGRPSSSVSCSR